jgi:hypothetical protein
MRTNHHDLSKGTNTPVERRGVMTPSRHFVVAPFAMSLFFIYQDLPGLPMALRVSGVSGHLTVLPTS